MGVVAGNNIPNYCIMSNTGEALKEIQFVFREPGAGDGEDGGGDEDPHQLHLQGAPGRGESPLAEPVLPQVGGFRCDYRGALDLGVRQCL